MKMIRTTQQAVEVDRSGRRSSKPLKGLTVEAVRSFMIVMARAQGATIKTLAEAMRCCERTVYLDSDERHLPPDLGPHWNRAMYGLDDEEDD